MNELFYRISSFWNSDLFGIDPSSYSIAINLFLRLLGAIYVVTYLPFLFQMRGLFGKNGILPIADYLDYMKIRLGKKRFYHIPTVLWLNASDATLLGLIWSGLILGILLMFGICAPIILLLLYIVHLSLTSAGQDFLSFGWETFLMEITIASFLMTATSPLNVFGWLSLNFLLLRFHVQAGASKLQSKDPNWANFTAISYHYLTQPLPNTIAWYFHKLPMWFHKFSVLMMFYVELLVPFAIFSPLKVRLLVFLQLAGLQFSIWFTGNLSYLNHMTIALCVILLNNRFLEPFFNTPAVAEPSSMIWHALISLLGAAFLALQVICLWKTFFPNKIISQILYKTYPFHLAYPHGIFAVMTTKRYEIIVEGSADGEVWQEYSFYYKPGELSKRPQRISPFQPRLDWQAWFLPFDHFESQGWFQMFLAKLLEGSPSVGKLLKNNPFVKKAPLYVRALVYDYEFTTIEERKHSGNWWKRTLIGEYAPAMRLKNIH